MCFSLIISSDESQSEAQFDTQSLGENTTGQRVENIDLFHRWKLQGKSTFVYIDL